MSQTLIFISDKNHMFFPYINSEGITVENVWRDEYRKGHNTFLIRVLRKLRIPVSYFFDRHWVDNKELNPDRIIIFDGCYDKLLAYYLDKRFRDAKKYVFCWNAAYRLKHVCGNSWYPIYSYSPKDCEKLGLEYMPTVYQMMPYKEQTCDTDVIFMGLVKDRGAIIDEIYCALTNAGNKVLFHVVGEQGELKVPVTKERMEYTDYIAHIGHCRAILDIANEGQDGLTQRVLESLFYRKKLITNNEDIVNYDFYNPANICVVSKGNVNIPEGFLDSPYVDIPEDMLAHYRMSSWVEQFEA